MYICIIVFYYISPFLVCSSVSATWNVMVSRNWYYHTQPMGSIIFYIDHSSFRVSQNHRSMKTIFIDKPAFYFADIIITICMTSEHFQTTNTRYLEVWYPILMPTPYFISINCPFGRCAIQLHPIFYPVAYWFPPKWHVMNCCDPYWYCYGKTTVTNIFLL